MPELPGLPDLPGLDEILPPLDDLLYGPQMCPVCKWYEDNVCRPLMQYGSVRECGTELAEVRALLGKIPEEEHRQLALAALGKYGIDPDASSRRK